ncbi:MAG: DUF192 domain-containing protein [Spirochaetaceae bacterium]|jgi:uncharacterized membrane protein (UPF0127 family)|nr:DUF192 domain-containing protein [Spirochaetaceae bacterium]
MTSRPVAQFLFCAFTFLFFVSCPSEDERAQPKLETKEFIIGTHDGKNIGINAEIARTTDERASGLMFRKSLADGSGMLFVFDDDSTLSFWMKNTLIPLSIAYINKDGVIMEIHDMKPKDLSPVQSRRPLRYALEVPLGWFDKSGVAQGDILNVLEKLGN